MKTDILEPKDILKLDLTGMLEKVDDHTGLKLTLNVESPSVYPSIHPVSLYLLLIWYEVPLLGPNVCLILSLANQMAKVNQNVDTYVLCFFCLFVCVFVFKT